MDSISNLPNEIIGHIGSFLSAKEAAFAMVLSKRWRNLFTIIPELYFDDSLDNEEMFVDFVDGVLGLPVTTRIRKFSLKWWFKDTEVAQYDHIHINRCLSHVLKLGIMDLELWVNGKKRGGGYSLPFEVFVCKTVAKLTLGYGFAIGFLPADAYLPSLKTLCLDSIWFYEFGRCAFNTLLSVSPKLEELVIDDVEFERWKWSFTVSSPTLQRLTIRREVWEPESDDVLDCRGLAYEFDSLSFDTPGLTYLEYDDYVPKEYPFVNLNSLVEAKLHLCVEGEEGSVWREGHADDFDPMNLINALKNVEILDLTIDTMEMFYVSREAMPVFENLFHISVNLSSFCWYSLRNILEKSPNLKNLTIKNSLHYDINREKEHFVCRCVSKYSFLLSCPLEVLKITKYYGSIGELEQMKRILEKLSCLKLVEVHAQVTGDEKLQVMEDLLLLPRASSKCKIRVKFS